MSRPVGVATDIGPLPQFLNHVGVAESSAIERIVAKWLVIIRIYFGIYFMRKVRLRASR
jgi:hypothetical protein